MGTFIQFGTTSMDSILYRNDEYPQKFIATKAFLEKYFKDEVFFVNNRFYSYGLTLKFQELYSFEEKKTYFDMKSFLEDNPDCDDVCPKDIEKYTDVVERNPIDYSAPKIYVNLDDEISNSLVKKIFNLAGGNPRHRDFVITFEGQHYSDGEINSLENFIKNSKYTERVFLTIYCDNEEIACYECDMQGNLQEIDSTSLELRKKDKEIYCLIQKQFNNGSYEENKEIVEAITQYRDFLHKILRAKNQKIAV